MKLRTKLIGLESGGKTIVVLNEYDAMELGVRPLERVVVANKSRKITCIVNTSKKLNRGRMMAYDEVNDIIKIRDGAYLDVKPRKELVSKSYIRKKIDGNELNKKGIEEIVNDIIARNLNDLEIASFITALHIRGITRHESLYFSKAMIATSRKLSFPGTVVDKHSIGGISGDKTSMILVPIIASTGLTIPKTSSRSITSPAGTADRMEVLAPVNKTITEIKKIVRKCGGCLVWGGAMDLAPADDLFIRIEHPLNLDSLLLPSVMSKKKVVGSKYLVIDIPTGPQAKVQTLNQAEKLADEFIYLGKKLGIKVDCAITKGDQTIGYAMGPALEARESLETLMGKGPKDAFDKATSVAGILLSMVKKGNKKTAEEIILSGRAEEKMREIIKAQGGNPDIRPEKIPYAKFSKKIYSNKTGTIIAINNKPLVNISWAAGAPADKLAGILLNKKIGNRVKKGEQVFTIYSEKKDKLKKAVIIAKPDEIFKILESKKTSMLIESV